LISLHYFYDCPSPSKHSVAANETNPTPEALYEYLYSIIYSKRAFFWFTPWPPQLLPPAALPHYHRSYPSFEVSSTDVGIVEPKMSLKEEILFDAEPVDFAFFTR
jgi:hypothetical protein